MAGNLQVIQNQVPDRTAVQRDLRKSAEEVRSLDLPSKVRGVEHLQLLVGLQDPLSHSR